MSIRLIAQELYQLVRDVEKIEKEIEKAPYEQQVILKERLRKLNAEKNRMRGTLDGQIDRAGKSAKR